MHTHFLGLLVKSILFIFFTLFIWYLYLRIRALVPYILHVMGFNRIYIHIGRSYYIVDTSFLYTFSGKDVASLSLSNIHLVSEMNFVISDKLLIFGLYIRLEQYQYHLYQWFHCYTTASIERAFRRSTPQVIWSSRAKHQSNQTNRKWSAEVGAEIIR